MVINFMYKKANNSAKQSGVTMVEALVAMLLFSVGALGLAAMQLTSLVNSGDSQQRSVAVFKAQELANRIKSNPSALATYISTINSNDVSVIGVDDPDNTTYITCGNGAGAIAQPTPLCSDTSTATASACTNAQQVNFDIWENGTPASEGSSGLVNLELVLRQNNDAADGNDDVAIYMEWLSRQGEQETGADTTADVVNIDSDLDVYCMRFRVR